MSSHTPPKAIVFFESDRGSGLGWSLLPRFGTFLSHWSNGSHGGLRKYAPALHLPLVILLRQHRTHQSHNGGVIWKDVHAAGAAGFPRSRARAGWCSTACASGWRGSGERPIPLTGSSRSARPPEEICQPASLPPVPTAPAWRCGSAGRRPIAGQQSSSFAGLWVRSAAGCGQNVRGRSASCSLRTCGSPSWSGRRGHRTPPDARQIGLAV
jgi:hypothetical protein